MCEHLEKNNKRKILESKSKGRKELQTKKINIKIPKYIEDKVSENNRVIQRTQASVSVQTGDTTRVVGEGTCARGRAINLLDISEKVIYSIVCVHAFDYQQFGYCGGSDCASKICTAYYI